MAANPQVRPAVALIIGIPCCVTIPRCLLFSVHPLLDTSEGLQKRPLEGRMEGDGWVVHAGLGQTPCLVGMKVTAKDRKTGQNHHL